MHVGLRFEYYSFAVGWGSLIKVTVQILSDGQS